MQIQDEQIHIHQCLNLHFSIIIYAIYNWYIPILFFIVLKFEQNIAKIYVSACLDRLFTPEDDVTVHNFFQAGERGGGGVFSISEFFNFLFTLHTVYHLKQFQQLKSACWYLEWNVLIYKLHFFFFIQLQYSSTTPLPHLLLLYPWFQLICLEQNVSLFWGWGTTNFYRF